MESDLVFSGSLWLPVGNGQLRGMVGEREEAVLVAQVEHGTWGLHVLQVVRTY